MTAIGVVFGGPSPEHDISILTGLQAARALHDDGVPVVCLYWTKTGRWLRVPPTAEAAAFLEPTVPGSSEVELHVPGGFVEPKRLRGASPLELEVVLNCCHGGPGEDGTLTGLLLAAGLKVTGPRPQAAALAMDKAATAAAARMAGVPTIATAIVTDTDHTELPPTPWVAKPRYGGSSIGVEAGIEDLDTVRALARTGTGRAGMVVQPFLEGWMDLNIAVRTHPTLQLSEIEKPLRDGSAVYDYTGKYLTGGQGMDAAPRELPAQIPDHVAETIRGYARTLVTVLDLSGAPRIDFLWDGGDQVVLCEVNSIPGAWGNHLWQATGVPRVQLYRELVDEARRAKPGLPQWAATSDGAALRVSGSIAAKLS
jgi:D-alanine-D-alanine ligase